MIKKLEINNYRKIQDLQLCDLRKINIFVGPNNCGKTSILESIILSSTFEDLDLLVNTLIARYYGFNTSYFKAIFPIGKKPMVSFETQIDEKILKTNISYSTHQKIRKEEVTHVTDTVELQFSYEYDRNVKKEEAVGLYKIRFIDNGNEYSVETEKDNENRREIKIPCKFVSFSRYASNGTLIEEVDKVLNQNLRKELIQILNIFDDEIQNFEILGQERVIKIFKANEERPLTLNDYGNGMYKAFYIATSALLARNGVLLVDEIEAGIHNKALADFITRLLKVCTDNQVQLFLTTHSLEAIDIILEDCKEQLEETAIYHIRNKNDKTLAKRYSGNKLFDLRNEIGFDVR